MIRKLLNPKANQANTLKVLKGASGCCGNGLEVCKYTFEDSNVIVVRGLKIQENGVETSYNLSDVPGGSDMITTYTGLGTNAEKVLYLRKTIFPALFEFAGYIIQDKDDIQIGSDLKSVIFLGEADVTAIITTGSDVTVDEVACKRIAICDYSGNYEGGDESFVIKVGSTTYTIEKGESATWAYPDDLSALNTELTTEMASTVLGVVAVDDAENTSFKITVTEPVGSTVVIDGSTAQCCNVRGDFEEVS